MKNRGFTLIELLGVLIVLGILGVIALTTIDKNIKKGIYQSCLAQEKVIKEAAKAWVLDNMPTATTNVTIATLKSGGYLEKDFKSPVTNSNYNSNTKVTVTVTTQKYSYTIVYGSDAEKCDSQKVG